MTSSKLSSRRQTRGTPPVCRKPPPPQPPSYPPAGLSEQHLRYLVASKLPDAPRPPFQSIDLRNLIFHLYAHRANDAATRALHQLRTRWDLFNGRKLIAVAHDRHTMPLRQIKRLLPGDAEYFVIPNDPRLRETASFPELLRTIRSVDPRTATFYAHAKGSSPTHNQTRSVALAIQLWALRMFHHLLDSWPHVDEALRTHATAGIYLIDYTDTPHQRITSPTGGPWGKWHYAGTFFWFRHDHIFNNPRWSMIPDDSYGPEQWLGSFIPANLAATLYQPFPPKADPQPNYYDPAAHSPPVPGPTG